MSDVERVKDAIDAVAFISTYVPLKRQGGRFVGRCPFHDDRSPSFSVRSDGLFHCFGCGAGGDILRFIELKEGLDFRAALVRAAEFAGVQLEASREDPADRARRQEAFAAGVQLLQNARTYFHRLLLDSSKAEAARAALERRAIPCEVWQRFELGYAWGEQDDWTKLVRKKGWSLGLSVELGLTAQNQSRDRFHHRLMFPIADPRGRPAGFGGRRLNEEDRAKYINSPDSPWFHKGQLLFGWDLAQPSLREGGRAVVCEGYTDVIRLHMAGVASAVAPLGTSLTEAHAARLGAHARGVVLAFDSDAAGAKAALRAWALLTQRGVDVFTLVLPAGDDPDSYGQEQGPEALAAAVEDAAPFWPRFLSERIGGAADADDKRTAIDAVLAELAAMNDPVYAELLAEELSEAAGVTAKALGERLRRERGRQQAPKPRPTPSRPDARRPRGVDQKLATYIVRHPEQRFEIQETLRDVPLHPWLSDLLTGRQNADPAYRQWLGETSFAELHQGDLQAMVAAVRTHAEQDAERQQAELLQAEIDDLVRAGRRDEAAVRVAALRELKAGGDRSATPAGSADAEDAPAVASNGGGR